jgi:hypothetical protein
MEDVMIAKAERNVAALNLRDLLQELKQAWVAQSQD